MEPGAFSEGSNGRLVRVGRGETAYLAFVPHPLPPAILFDHGLVSKLSEADRALGELAGLGRTFLNPHLLVGPFIHLEAVLSSRIEGTQASLADVYAYKARQLRLPGLKPAPAEADVREVFNYVLALEYGLYRLDTLPASLRLIRELHQRLMEGAHGEGATPGEFRRSPNWIGRPGCTLNEATFVPPPVPEMHQALDTFEKYLHADDTYPPLVRLAFIHYQFEAIHPFLDGNGRIGRLLTSLLLVHWQLLPLPLLYLSAFLERHRQEYYDLLLAVSQRGAWHNWVGFFLGGVAEQAKDATQRARRLQDLQTGWRREVERLRNPGLMLRIVDYLFELPSLSAADAQKRFAVSHPTALRALQRLEERGVLEETSGRKRGRQYQATAILSDHYPVR